MKKKNKHEFTGENLRINPEKRLCPQYDSTSIAKYTVASRDKMGFRVLDNCVEENIQ